MQGERCPRCDAKVMGVINEHVWYRCGRVSFEGTMNVWNPQRELFSCDPRLEKQRCRADSGRALVTFKEFLATRINK